MAEKQGALYPETRWYTSYMQSVYNHFKTHDPQLYQHLKNIPRLKKLQPVEPEQYFHHLCREIISQQLSSKAGDVILSRFEKLFTSSPIRPDEVLKLSHSQLRAVGMSHAKARYIRHLAEDIENLTIDIFSFQKSSDEDVIRELTKVKGIGRWTAEMFLMFALGREDVFSHGDLGLKKGLQRVYVLDSKPTDKEAEAIISDWSPYKTYGAQILWDILDL